MSRRRIVCKYCGPSPILPAGYDIFGTPYDCLRSGIGAGKYGERRTWQRRLGVRVDPDYHSPCGENRVFRRSRIMRAARRGRDRARGARGGVRGRGRGRGGRRARSSMSRSRSPRSRSRSSSGYRGVRVRGRGRVRARARARSGSSSRYGSA